MFVNASEVFDGWREIPSANLGEVMVFTSDQIRGDDVADFLGALEKYLAEFRSADAEAQFS